MFSNIFYIFFYLDQFQGREDTSLYFLVHGRRSSADETPLCLIRFAGLRPVAIPQAILQKLNGDCPVAGCSL
jgi:hypothetical protein